MADVAQGRRAEAWPELPLEAWRDTRWTLHMWTQIVGKVRLALAPMTCDWWQVPLYVGARGLTTSPIPDGDRVFEIAFDLVDHRLVIATSDGLVRFLPLAPRSVAAFYDEVMAALAALGIGVAIHAVPVEVPDPIPFAADTQHASYDPVYVNRFHRVLVQADAALKAFRTRFTAKASPVHFFWGTFDLALSLYSGRPAQVPAGADRITRIAMANEQVECGFWPGDARFPQPAFYSFTYPAPPGYERQPVRPEGARWVPELGEFLFPYAAAREAADPRRALHDFFESTYLAGARCAGWDLAALERKVW